MTLIQSLLRRLSSQQAAVAPKAPQPLLPEQLKAVAGGDGGATASPRNTW